MSAPEELIGRLSAGLVPVRPISPWRRGLALSGLAAVLVALATVIAGFRPDLHYRLMLPQDVMQWLASIATGGLALLAAAMLAQPDRHRAWALLPLPAAAVWIGALGLGCLGDMARLGPEAMEVTTSWGCLRFIIGLGLPLTVVSLLLLRHAWPMRAVPVAALAGLGAAAFCSAGLSLFHHLDAALMVLLWHGMATLVTVGLAALVGRALPRAIQGSREA
ncbi:NrsF family protein [Muricoccus radiodurans]|uniref:NrsF family protein n=1 Tax=Muricoccus radiodurans TaxID=2231721 RepID=UPI003CEB3BD8